MTNISEPVLKGEVTRLFPEMICLVDPITHFVQPDQRILHLDTTRSVDLNIAVLGVSTYLDVTTMQIPIIVDI